MKTYLGFSESKKGGMLIKNKNSILHRRRLGKFIIRTKGRNHFLKDNFPSKLFVIFFADINIPVRDYSVVKD